MRVFTKLRAFLGGPATTDGDRVLGDLGAGPFVTAQSAPLSWKEKVEQVRAWRRAGCPRDKTPPQLFDPFFSMPDEFWQTIAFDDPRSFSNQARLADEQFRRTLDYEGRLTDVKWSGRPSVPAPKVGSRVIQHPDGRLTEFV